MGDQIEDLDKSVKQHDPPGTSTDCSIQQQQDTHSSQVHRKYSPGEAMREVTKLVSITQKDRSYTKDLH